MEVRKTEEEEGKAERKSVCIFFFPEKKGELESPPCCYRPEGSYSEDRSLENKEKLNDSVPQRGFQ